MAPASRRSPVNSEAVAGELVEGAEPAQEHRHDEQHVQAGEQLAGGAEQRHLLDRRHRE